MGESNKENKDCKKIDFSNITVRHQCQSCETWFENSKLHTETCDSCFKKTLQELLDYGLEVFNNETEKFQHWLDNSNLYLGNVTPMSLLNTLKGIEKVRNILNRIEYGNFA